MVDGGEECKGVHNVVLAILPVTYGQVQLQHLHHDGIAAHSASLNVSCDAVCMLWSRQRFMWPAC